MTSPRFTRVITDNGPCYTSDLFTSQLDAEGITHQRIRPYTPRHNGKIERYNRILTEELLYARPYQSETQRAQAITVWILYARPYQSEPSGPKPSLSGSSTPAPTSQNPAGPSHHCLEPPLQLSSTTHRLPSQPPASRLPTGVSNVMRNYT